MNKAVYSAIRLVTVATAMSALTGCQTVQGWLNTGEDTAVTQESLAAQTYDPARALQVSEMTTMIALERARAYAQGRADGMRYDASEEHRDATAELRDASAKASLRTLKRKKAKPAGNPLELVDPTVVEARVELNDDLRQAYRASVKEDDSPELFTGNFSTQEGTELVVFKPGKEVVIYGHDARIARLDIAGDAAPEAFAELDLEIDPSGVQAVDLIGDDTLQLLTHRRVPTEDGTFAYKISVLKVIGPFVAEVFTHTLATSETENGPLTRVGAYEFLRGETHRDIRWIPADDAGQLLVGQAEVLKWNHWEGMYRVPAPPAAGPKRNNNLQASEAATPGPSQATLAPRHLSTHPG